MYNLKLGRKGIKEAAELEKGCDLVGGYTERCVRCISAMSPGEQTWHDNNNQEWIEHKAKDRRRRKRGAPINDINMGGGIIMKDCVRFDGPFEMVEKKGFISSLFGWLRG